MKRALAFVVFLAASAAPAGAQGVSFLPRSAFQMSAERIFGSGDERFRWDADFGGVLDFVDYTYGRLIFLANYEAILGEQFQLFDPNQGNYTLEGALTARLKQSEAGVVFHHVSRHLSDRAKAFPVDWNMLGGRVTQAFLVNGTYINLQGDLRWVIQHSFVDYRWEMDTHGRIDRQLTPAIGVLAAGGVRYLGVDGTAGRGGQTGFRAEAGFRFQGGGGAVELFVAGERRIDPDPLEFGTGTWMTAGFRLLSR
jgi:hypothetical protein